ncbi:MAG: hypothetical protein A2Y17_00810 [Clostridiales bacterium GWF2_38_85]|nr:MAG: hypothetical protein A2Y17_00810 [Clostridiales bacterium GWF2_38_85]
MSMTGKYIYCFIAENEKKIFCNSTLSSVTSAVYSIPYKGISAIVSDTNIYEYDPSRKNVRSHQQIVSRIMESYTIIPVAFGTVSNNKLETEKYIANNYDNLVKQLDYFKDKFEVGLRATWNDDFFNEDIENDDIKALKAIVSGKDENEVLIDKVQLGKFVEQATLRKKEEYIALIYEPLSKIAVESNTKDDLPIKTVFNANFLINKTDSDSFDNMVEKLCKPYDKKLNFSYTGPWPPYNFVNIKLKIESDNKKRK